MVIFVIGFMGCGKTYWSRKWSEAYRLPVHDMDEILEKEEGASCLQIFENHGEHYFREKEARLLRQLGTMAGDRIVSCGGGTPVYKDNMRWMNEHGLTVYLSASPEYLLANITSDESSHRPLIKNIPPNELLFQIHKKLNERLPIYQQAKITWQVHELTVEHFENCLTHA
jgi:shikimate kinase